MSKTVLLVLALAVAGVGPAPAQSPRGERLLVAAAASLSPLAEALSQAYRGASGIEVRFNFAASNTLARQIIEGARVDAFISADAAQMDVLEKAGRLVTGSRFDLVSNQLVIVVPTNDVPREWPSALATPAIARVAMGDPAAVPAGVYGRRWLEALGLWPQVARKVVPLPASPAALAAVREGRAQAGIVYATDARSPAAGSVIRVAYAVPVDDAPAIVYPAAAVAGGREYEAARFLSFLRDGAARTIFEAAGFRRVERAR